MREDKTFRNNGEFTYNLAQLFLNNETFTFGKNKKDKHIGLYCMINPITLDKYRWVSDTEYELLKALKPYIYHKIRVGSINFMYDTYTIKYLSNSQYKKSYISISDQKINLNINRWKEITYNYTTKFNLAGLIKQLKATVNLIPTYKYLECKPSIVQVLTQIYYDPNYILTFMKNPSEYLEILQEVDFYHYFKMLHPETTYSYLSIDTDNDNP